MYMETKESQPQFERERTRETKEQKEVEASPEAQAAAAMERAEIIVKEVQSNKKQMQNILMHMGQVQAAIKALRKQLALQDIDHDASVLQDAATVEKLKEKIRTYKDELLAMQDDLLRAQLNEIRETQPNILPEEQSRMAIEAVQAMISFVVDA
jgi:uncharacterized protein YbgA (DUF1722 family)